jgi:DNA-binding CsgD family transcriptional regulator
MEKTNTLFLYEIYVKYVETISGIRFTQREIDVIACVLYNRGATIPSFLQINPRTVETHKRNIMHKIRCNSREGIIDFIEKSDKHEHIKQYYLILIITRSFERCLKRIADLRVNKPPVHLIINCDSVLYQSSLVQGIVKDSQLAGIHLHLNLHETYSEGESPSPNLIVMSATGARPFIRLQPNLSDDQLKTAYVLFDEADNAIVLLEENEAFCFYKDPDTHYYDAFLSFLERLISDVDLTRIFQEFRQKLHKCPPVFHDPPAFSDDTQQRPLADTFTNNQLFAFCKRIKKKLFIGVISILLGIYVTPIFFHETHTLRSELSLPKKSILLKRPLLEQEMRLVMHAQTGIKKIVLVGIGGSGKTTAARMYARSEKAKIIWELNAKTPETLIHSLTDLSHALAHTKEKKEGKRSVPLSAI